MGGLEDAKSAREFVAPSSRHESVGWITRGLHPHTTDCHLFAGACTFGGGGEEQEGMVVAVVVVTVSGCCSHCTICRGADL